MSYGLAMSAEIRDWLSELCRGDHQAAMSAGQALTALMTGGAGLGPPTVRPAVPPRRDDPRAGLDDAYQQRLEQLRALRHRAAGHTGQVAERERQARADADAFRVRKEVLKARYTAAEAERELALVLGQEAPDAELAEATRTLREVGDEIDRVLGRDPPATGLFELRPDGADDGEVAMVFAVEPPGRVLLIAAAQGRDEIRGQWDEVLAVSADVLSQVQAGTDPDAAAHVYDVESFLSEFFPDVADQVRAGAAALLA